MSHPRHVYVCHCGWIFFYLSGARDTVSALCHLVRQTTTRNFVVWNCGADSGIFKKEPWEGEWKLEIWPKKMRRAHPPPPKSRACVLWKEVVYSFLYVCMCVKTMQTILACLIV